MEFHSFVGVFNFNFGELMQFVDRVHDDTLFQFSTFMFIQLQWYLALKLVAWSW